MEQSSLFELIRTLSQQERALVLQIAHIPLFNQGKMKSFAPKLTEICLDPEISIKNPGLDKTRIYAELFPNQPYIEGRIEKVMVEVHKIIKNALLIKNYLLDGNEFMQGIHYAEILRKKSLTDRYSASLARLQKSQNEQKIKNLQYFDQQVLLDNAIHEFECLNNQKKGDLLVPQLLQILEITYEFKRINILNRLLLQQKFSKIEIPESLNAVIEKINLPADVLSQSAIFKANFEVFCLLRKPAPDNADIRSLFEFLKTHEAEIDSESHQELYSYLRSLCILLLSQDIENIPLEFMLNDLYKDNLKRGFLHYEGKLHPSRYWAVSSNAIRVKDFEWAIWFIEKYKDELMGENETRDIYRLNLANYYFGIGEFEQCLNNIPPNSNFLDYLLSSKRLELKTHYELNSDLLPYKIDAFKVYLSRTSPKQISPFIKQQLNDFVNLLAQLAASIPGDNKRADILIRRIREKKQAAEWRWLLEKAEAL
jgi:hypothetical protein